MSKPSLNELLERGLAVSTFVLREVEESQPNCRRGNCGSLPECRPKCQTAAKKSLAEMSTRVAAKLRNEI